METYRIDLRHLIGQVHAIKNDAVPGLSVCGGGGTVWATADLAPLIDAIGNSEAYFNGSLMESSFVQYAAFYLLGVGKLSTFINYEKTLSDGSIRCRPVSVSFILTKLCNFRCVHCYNESGLPHPDELLPEEKVSLVEYFGRWGVSSLVLSGGEPTLDPSFPAILQAAARHRMKVRLTTNGWNLPNALLEHIKKGVVEQVNVSVDGSSPSTHHAFRDKPGSFERAMSAIPKLKDSGLKTLVINSCVGAGRIGDMDAIVRLAIHFQCNRVSFKALLHIGRSEAHAEDRVLSASEMAVFQQERERLRSKYQCLIEIEGHLITEAVPENLVDEVACNAGTSAMTVGADGSMYPCEIISPFVVAPNARRVPPAQAWTENAIFKEFRALRAGAIGGCGTLGCPGSRMPKQHLTTIAGT